ncbi:MAG: biotin/lipoyl-containing protein [Bacteroidales bacterium]
MLIELNPQGEVHEVEILERQGARYRMKVDEKVYDIDLVEVANGIYSLIVEGRSFSIEAIASDNPRSYTVNTFVQTFDLEILDAQARYLRSRNQGQEKDQENLIRVPMPGKVVDILVKEGDTVAPGQTLAIVSAMKMDSEYKSGKAGSVRRVLVKAGDTVDSDQVLIELE